MAIRTDFSEKHVSTVINGQKSISPSFAKKLEYALKIPASDIPYNAAYRAQISNNVAVDAYVLYAWQCLCERLTEKVPIDSTLDKDLLRDKLSEIKSLMFDEPNVMRELLTKIFSECGILQDILSSTKTLIKVS